MTLLTALLLFAFVQQAQPVQAPHIPAENFTLWLMDSTFKIQGPSAKEPGKLSVGTGFVLARPTQPGSTEVVTILVTATHVFADIQGDSATLVLRVRTPAARYQRFEHPIPIRPNLGYGFLEREVGG